MFKHPFHEQAFRADMQKVVPASPVGRAHERFRLNALNVAQMNPMNCATGRNCEFGPYGPLGMIQCRFCGDTPKFYERYRDETAVGTHAVAVGGSVLELIEACRTFCARVEAGEVRSVRTYSMFKTLLARIDGEA